MARAAQAPLAAGEHAPGVLSAGQAAGLLGFPDPQAVTALAAAGELPGLKVGASWLFDEPAIRGWQPRWPGLYRRIAGPGVPDGPVLGAAAAAERLGFRDKQTVTDLAAAGQLPGVKIAGTWLFAWMAIYQQIAGPGVPDGPVLGAAAAAERLGFRDKQTVTDLAAAGQLPGVKIAGTWLFAWMAIYQQIAGPGVPDGPVLGAAALARQLGVPSVQVIRRSAARPGGLPGRRIGKHLLFAAEAVRLRMAGQPGAGQDGAAPAGSPPGE